MDRKRKIEDDLAWYSQYAIETQGIRSEQLKNVANSYSAPHSSLQEIKRLTESCQFDRVFMTMLMTHNRICRENLTILILPCAGFSLFVSKPKEPLIETGAPQSCSRQVSCKTSRFSVAFRIDNKRKGHIRRFVSGPLGTS